MAKVELELNEAILRHARQAAAAEHSTLEQWLADTIERGAARPAPDALLGLFSDAPELIDTVTEDALAARERHPLRQAHG